MPTSDHASSSTNGSRSDGTSDVTAPPTYRAFDFTFTLDGAAAGVAADVMGCMRAEARST